MERRNLALLCAGVVCFWLFALAFGTAQDSGLRWVEAPAAAQTAVAGEEMQPAALTAAQPDLTLNCRAVCLIDQDTGTVLYEKNADQQMPIASITKVMTLLLTFEAIHDGRLTLDTLVPVSEHAYHMGGSQIWLEPGEQFTLDEMIKAICVSSANDAAVAVAELVGGSEQGFVQMMNDRAAELGIRFVLDPASELRGDGQYLPASSLITILGNLMENAIEELSHDHPASPDVIHASESPREIHIGIYCRPDVNIITCEDTGDGVPEDIRERVFQRGFSSKGPGRGLGLAMVRDITLRHGGTIDLDTEPHTGTCFTLTFTKERS